MAKLKNQPRAEIAQFGIWVLELLELPQTRQAVSDYTYCGTSKVKIWISVQEENENGNLNEWSKTMSSRTARLLVMCGFLLAGLVMTGVALQAHHAVAGVYDLNKEVVLLGRLKKLNFTNPHASIELSVPDKDGKVTDWILTTASTQVLTREGINKTSMKPGEILKVTILPARNGNPAGFIRNLQLGDRDIKLFFGNGVD